MKMQRAMTRELARLEQLMTQRWHELAMAEQRGVSVPALEYMYDIYLVAQGDYIQCRRALLAAELAREAAAS